MKQYENTLGKALAGHAARVQNTKDKSKYDNSLTDLIDLIIAEIKTKESIKK